MRLGHLRLDVADLDRQTAFYTEVLGLAVRERATDDVSHYAFLTDRAPIPEGSEDGMHHRLVLRQARDGSAPGPTGRFDHFAWEAETPAELLAVVERVRERGGEVDLQDAQIAWQAYFHDPEGTRVEVYCDRRTAPDGDPLWRGRQQSLDEARLVAGAKDQD
ncbi:VOC family protein [Rubrivirga sp. IMCC45206]|uniref:VOC family protein n=1 Tax=Rubrivirga sp. IMCC45206 TaxID=3391614 RepID=UPI0039900F26